jgi:hypothetical protein
MRRAVVLAGLILGGGRTASTCTILGRSARVAIQAIYDELALLAP